MRRLVLALSLLLFFVVAREAFASFTAWRDEVANADRDVVVLGYLGIYKPLGYALLALLVLGIGVGVARSRNDREGRG